MAHRVWSWRVEPDVEGGVIKSRGAARHVQFGAPRRISVRHVGTQCAMSDLSAPSRNPVRHVGTQCDTSRAQTTQASDASANRSDDLGLPVCRRRGQFHGRFVRLEASRRLPGGREGEVTLPHRRGVQQLPAPVGVARPFQEQAHPLTGTHLGGLENPRRCARHRVGPPTQRRRAERRERFDAGITRPDRRGRPPNMSHVCRHVRARLNVAGSHARDTLSVQNRGELSTEPWRTGRPVRTRPFGTPRRRGR